MFEPDTLLQDRYRIVRALNEGARSAVYEAQDEQMDRRVALKAWQGVDAGQQQALAAAMQARQRLFHPALPEVHDTFVEGDSVVAVMSWLPGETLAEWMAGRAGEPLPELRQIAEWGDQMLEALGYLHSRQPALVHGDIKPSNVRLTPDGIMLGDLDVPLGDAAPAAASSPYRAPEYLFTRTPTPSSDLYSVAATLYFLLTGVEPPDARARTAAWRARQPDPLRPINEINPQLPPALADVLGAALAVNPAQRPRSASALRAALREAKFAPPSSPAVEAPPIFLEEEPIGKSTVVLAEPAFSSVKDDDGPVEETPIAEPEDRSAAPRVSAPPAAAPPPKKPASRAKSCLWVVLGAGVVVVGACCLLLILLAAFGPSIEDMFQGSAATPAATVPAEGRPVSVFDLEEGYCFNDPTASAEAVGELLVVPCEQPHDNEVYALVQYPADAGAPFPATEVLEQYADEQCTQSFDAYVGIPYDQSSLYYWTITPTSDSWTEGDREIICSIYDGQGDPLRGSMQGSQQ